MDECCEDCTIYVYVNYSGYYSLLIPVDFILLRCVLALTGLILVTTLRPDTASMTQELFLVSIQVRSAISVHWPEDQEYYNAKVTAKNCQSNVSASSNVCTLLYEDGEVDTIDLAYEMIKIEKIVSSKDGANSIKKRKSNTEGDVHHPSSAAKNPSRKKKRFQERLANLAPFKAHHGNCNAPQSHQSGEKISLSRWYS